MKRVEFSRNIAWSLTLGPWRDDVLAAALRRRLPVGSRPEASEIADGLVRALPGRYAPSVARIAEALRQMPAFERLYVQCRRRGVWPDPELTAPSFAPISGLAHCDVPRLATLAELADWLIVPPGRLDYLADPGSRHERHGDMAVNHYHYVLQAKRDGRVRLIEAPKTGLKAVQRRILRGILEHVPNHADAFGFVRGRNCLEGAARHAGEDVVVCFDLAEFFPSIRASRIHGIFRCLGYPGAVAGHLTGLCTNATPPRVLDRMPADMRATFRGPHLPQGSPASPYLANLVSFGLDRRLSGLARRLGARYSRYADDLTFSGDRGIAGMLLGAVPEIVRDEGFRINAGKTRVMSRASRQVVTGVVVNAHLNIDRTTFDRLKAVIHACGRAGDTRLRDAAFRASLLGKIDWVEAVNPHRGRKLRRLLAEVAERAE